MTNIDPEKLEFLKHHLSEVHEKLHQDFPLAAIDFLTSSIRIEGLPTEVKTIKVGL